MKCFLSAKVATKIFLMTVTTNIVYRSKKMTWIVIAYKPSSEDYCRGCLMASYDSDFEMKEFEDIGQVR